MVDSHCHLAGEEFAADLDAVVARATGAGVDSALCILEAEEAAEVQRAPLLSAAWPSIRFAAAIHPHHAGRFSGRVEAGIAEVARVLDATGACALGEIGLDYHYDFSPREIQQDVFRAQIRLAAERRLPVIIHTREATADTFDILEEEGCRRGVFHCFTGDEAMAERALALGFHLSFAGIVTFPKAAALRAVAAATPMDRILCETDSPYLAPVPHRGKRNEPAFVARVVEAVAELRGCSVEAMAGQTSTNFIALFG